MFDKVLNMSLIDVTLIAEIKLDLSFRIVNFICKVFMNVTVLCILYRSDCVFLAQVKNELPSRHILKFAFPSDVQIISFELNIRKEKWSIVSTYCPLQNSCSQMFHKIEVLKFWQSSHQNICARVSLFNNVAGCRSATLLKATLWQNCFPENFAKFFLNFANASACKTVILLFLLYHSVPFSFEWPSEVICYHKI